MHISIAGLHLLSGEAYSKMQAIAADEGHTLVAAGKSDVAALWQEVKDKFPAMVDAITKGIADVKNSSLSGGEKAVKVATDVIPLLPAIVQELPNVKSFAVHGVTEVFAELEAAGKLVLTDLAAKL